MPAGTKVLGGEDTALPQGLKSASEKDLFTDVFIAGSGEKAESAYGNIEVRLARSAAVNFIDGDLTAPIRSRHAHYVSRHQICGENVPWHMTNTSEPHSDDMVEQANNPVSFDWMVKGICGLSSVPQMMEKWKQNNLLVLSILSLNWKIYLMLKLIRKPSERQQKGRRNI